MRLAKLLQVAGLATSAGEATRKLKENAVSVNGEKVLGEMVIALGKGRCWARSVPVLRLGKKSGPGALGLGSGFQRSGVQVRMCV